jgi:signal transduction histidine kinase/Flp pilus assembly protein TadD
MKLAIILTFALRGVAPDSVLAETYFVKYQRYQYRNYDSALAFLDLSIAASEASERKKRQAELLREKGIFLKDNGKFPESVDALKKAITLFEEIRDDVLQAASYNNLGVTYWRSGDNENALSCYLKSRDMNLKLNNKPGLVRNHIALGNYFAVQHEYQQAIESYEDALGFAGPDDKPMYALVLKNTGNIYNDTKFTGHNAERAVEYYQKSLSAYTELGDTINIAGLHVNMGLVYENQNDLDNARRQYAQAIAMQNRYGLKADVVNSYLNLGNVLLKKGDTPEAKQSYLRGFEIAASIGNKGGYRNLARKLSVCLEKEKQYQEAYRFFQLYDSVDQIIYNDQTTATIKELETKYGTEKKQAEINLRTQQRDSVMITLIVVLVMTTIIVLIYSQRQKVVAQLRARDKTLMNNKIDELLREQEIRSLRAYLDGQDEERKRLAEDLHDRLGSTLSATKLYFNSMNRSDPDKQQSLEKINKLLDTAVEEVREISHNLLSGSITKFGLATALHELKETIASSNQVNMELFIHGMDGRLDNKAELHLYRIVQELVSNILKHANATEITVQLNKQLRELSLTVEDNGKGFDPGVATGAKGVGLQNVASRVQSLDGSLLIDSGKGNGTTILINIPITT